MVYDLKSVLNLSWINSNFDSNLLHIGSQARSEDPPKRRFLREWKWRSVKKILFGISSFRYPWSVFPSILDHRPQVRFQDEIYKYSSKDRPSDAKFILTPRLFIGLFILEGSDAKDTFPSVAVSQPGPPCRLPWRAASR